ncbi:MAG TPA: TonB-dependent receptor [Hanamia sp.]|nr:TonB-dependent receptor [Hanamia sp.]
MKKFIGFIIVFCITPAIIFAQKPKQQAYGQRNFMGRGPAIGQVIGRVLNGKNNKGIGFATVEVLRAKDSSLVTGVLSKDNGDFTIDQLPLGNFILHVNFVGSNAIYHPFVLTPDNSSIDLGNFKLTSAAVTLHGVTINANPPAYTMSLDKKVFDASKSLVSAGGDATDVLKQIPSVNVDIDGNVTLRNGTPKIYIDGKQTILTLDEIPAESIAKVEVITNPSAKYSAEGMSGIINIILKKNRKPGINGLLRAGGDSRGGANVGANLSVYKNPLNFTMSYFLHQHAQPSTETLSRHNIIGNNWLDQNTDGKRSGTFQMGQIGLDYYVTNRNTISLNGRMGGGNFITNQTLKSSFLDSTLNLDSTSNNITYNKNHFQFYSGDLGFKHTFAKEGHNLTADFNLQTFTNGGNGNFLTQFFDKTGNPIPGNLVQTNNSNGKSSHFSGQVDYVNPLTDKSKLEAGLKTTMRNYSSTYDVYDVDSTGSFFNNYLSSDYTFDENIYAAYLQFSSQWDKLSYQLGLRSEDYVYSGAIPSQSLKFKPVSDKPGLYPSAYLTYKLTTFDQIQLNYSRRVDRPNFWQRIPYINFSDPQNLTKGNPDLKPQYTNSFELAYNKLFGISSNFMTTFYFRNTLDQITRYTEPFNNSSDTLITYSINANTNNSYGAEFTLATPLTKWWDITANMNLFQTNISASVKSVSFSSSKFSWFAKLNSNMKLPSHFSIQIDGNYNAPIATPQGISKEFGYVDIGIKKDFLKKKNASVNLSLSDIFNTREHENSYAIPDVFTQNSVEKRASRFVRLNFTYNFGKQNFQLFRKKQNKSQQSNQGGENDLIPQQ